MFFELKFSGKMSEEKNVASLCTKAKQIALNFCDYFQKDVKRPEISHIELTIKILSEDATKITI